MECSAVCSIFFYLFKEILVGDQTDSGISSTVLTYERASSSSNGSGTVCALAGQGWGKEALAILVEALARASLIIYIFSLCFELVETIVTFPADAAAETLLRLRVSAGKVLLCLRKTPNPKDTTYKVLNNKK